MLSHHLRRPSGLHRAFLLSLTAAALTSPAWADEAAIRKTLADRMPSLPKIDEISKTPVAGLYEVRMGAELLYTDETGNFLIDGSIFDTKARVNLTQARVEKLTAIDFANLPLKDAMVMKQGTGLRKMAVFADPNCGYCKRLEKDLLTLKDVTIYTFVLPILGGDSALKSRNIVCAKEPMKVWRSWMIDGAVPARSAEGCDATALERNQEFARKYKINGTPALVFEDGTRAPGAWPADRIEKQLVAARKS